MTKILELDGRAHKHGAFESFFVVSGRGQVFVDDKIHDVNAGDLVTIPPRASHWMEPHKDTGMNDLLWR